MFLPETPQQDINLSQKEQAEISRILNAKNIDDKQKFLLLSQLQSKISATTRNVQPSVRKPLKLKAMKSCGSDTEPVDGESLRRPSIDSKVKTAKLSARRVSHVTATTKEASQTVRYNSVKPSKRRERPI